MNKYPTKCQCFYDGICICYNSMSEKEIQEYYEERERDRQSFLRRVNSPNKPKNFIIRLLTRCWIF